MQKDVNIVATVDFEPLDNWMKVKDGNALGLTYNQ